MWKLCLELSADTTEVTARLPADADLGFELNRNELDEQLAVLGAKSMFVSDSAVARFINCAKVRNAEAYAGFNIAYKRDAEVKVELSNNDMLASMVVTGAYGGRGLLATEIVRALAQAHVLKGINKLALRKVLAVSSLLKPGETFTQPVAVGKAPIKGKDAIFTPLVEDITKRVLKPKEGSSSSEKIDLRNLGETIAVDIGEEVMRRTPATKGIPGFTVKGRTIPPTAGKNCQLKAGKGTEISPADPNLLIASVSGTPLIRDRSIEVDNALCLNSVGINTGHVSFKGNVIIGGNIESGMIVKATGSITVGGFIESADVQALGDIQVAKGIIGHNVSDGQPKSCRVKAKGSIQASYAQYCDLQAGTDIKLALHCMNNDILCGRNLIVLDTLGNNGTLSGGDAKVGNKIICAQLGVEGDTATKVQAFSRFTSFKKRLVELKQQYKNAQEETMNVIRHELAVKKRPKSERSHEEQVQIEVLKKQNSEELELIRQKLEQTEYQLEVALEENVVEAKEHVFTRVTVQFEDEQVTTKRVHGGCIFSFDQYAINVSANLGAEDIAI